jgi:Asp-tRNA(Asn)/Glu-tRNA(Gln) amidotransferase A subunit family amidase
MKTSLLWLALLLNMHTNAQDTIAKQDIVSAAKLFHLQFTPKEIDTMYAGIKENLGVYASMHRNSINNQTPMSLWQNPQVPGLVIQQQQKPIKWAFNKSVALPQNQADLAFYSIADLSVLIKQKKISSVALTQLFINRIKFYADSLQCVISITDSMALVQAAAADAELANGIYRGPLHGIPYGLKDLFAVKGTKTTWGAEPYKNQVIEEDAYVYQRLKEAGAVLVAKFTLGALAMGDYWYGGRTKNPWNLKTGSSGSSAGSASATVAGLVPFAIGTETWGSIISPASTCGATGLRPTFGRISRTGAMALSWSLDKIGPICRTAEDAAIVFSQIHGTDGQDLSAVNLPFNYQPKAPLSSLKIGYAKNYFDLIRDTSRNEWKVLASFKEMGIDLIPIEFPDTAVYKANIMDVIISAESAAAFDDLTRFNIDDALTRQGPFDWPNNFRVSRLVPAVEYVNANRMRYQLQQKVHAALQGVDVLICPTRGSGNQSAITNLTGQPVVCVPTGFDKRSGLPTSISFIGNLYNEAAILLAAKYYQQATEWETMHPPLFIK